MQKKTSISILEGNTLYRTLLTRMISSITDYVLVGIYGDVHTARTLLNDPSEVVIVDLEAGEEEDIFRFIRALNKMGTVSVIACSQQDHKIWMRKVFAIGVNGYIIKDSTYDEFRANLMLALKGGVPMSRSVVRNLVECVRKEILCGPSAELSESVSQTCQMIEEVLASPYSLKQENLSDFLSRQIGFSYHQLSMLFKKEMGINLSQYVILKKIEKVKLLIGENHFSLTQIANLMDYSSVAHLSTQFRKSTGVTPTEFKRIFSSSHS
jgi:AraC family transcriptional regulator